MSPKEFSLAIIVLLTFTTSVSWGAVERCELDASRTEVAADEPSFAPRQRFAYQTILPAGSLIEHVAIDNNEKYIAIVSKVGNFEANARLTIYDAHQSKTILTEHFTSIKSAIFIEDSGVIAVTGTRAADGVKHKAYLIKFAPESALLAGPPRSNSLVKISEASAARPQNLTLPGSPTRGVNVRQIIRRDDLPFTFVVQESPNSREGDLTRQNTGAEVFDSANRHLGELRYGALVPKDIQLNPLSSLMALHLIDPTGKSGHESIVVVDGHRPEQILYHHDFNFKGYALHSERGSAIVSKSLTANWSPDGQKLAVLERQTGSVVVYDVKKEAEETALWSPDERWPLAGGFFVDNTHYLLLRIGDQPAGLALHLEPIIRAHVVDLTKPLDLMFARSFDLRSSAASEGAHRTLFQAGTMITGFAMKNGAAAVVSFRNQLVLMSLKDPSQQTALVPLIKQGHLSNILSVKPLSQDVIEIVDRVHGIFELDLP